MNDFTFARRTNWQNETNALNKAVETLKAQGASILDLTVSNPTECGFFYPANLLSVLSSSDNLRYDPDACGIKEAREVVFNYYAKPKVKGSIDDIVLTASTSEAYSFLMRLLINPGEKVLVPAPSYPLFQFLLEINDVNFAQYPLVYDGEWRMDIQALESLVDEKTRAIILVNPNNPTGSYVGKSELVQLNNICERHQLTLISDEVFFDYAFYQGDFVSLLGNDRVLTFVLGGLSKTLGLPQMKCAWILSSGPQALLKDAQDRLSIIADTYLSVNTPVQNALRSWLGMAPGIQEQIMARVKENAAWLKAQLRAHTEILSIQGGWYAVLRIPAIKSEEEWCLEFVREDQVLVYPGYFFDFPKEAYIVVSLLPEKALFQQGISRIMSRLDEKIVEEV
ncbi:MAG: pyridoxal phosphate-dependent aminotransferase [Candidatus Omnitrophica bacterium]|nr:pyridoxal phosphate-dependent aminotransferase [Candidatus Omnitrophota bacterium]